ncbi:hypothetical protein [Acinetobacter baumannii]
MKILNKVEAKLAWANGELLLVNNTERNGWNHLTLMTLALMFLINSNFN